MIFKNIEITIYLGKMSDINERFFPTRDWYEFVNKKEIEGRRRKEEVCSRRTSQVNNNRFRKGEKEKRGGLGCKYQK